MANRLGMTEEQMIEEIEVMRSLENYLIKVMGEEHYRFLCMEHAREESAELLRRLGATEEEIVDIAKKVETELGWNTTEH